MSANSIALDLQAPGSVVYTAELALKGQRLNHCALGLRLPANRDDFASGPEAYLRKAGLAPEELALVLAKDWTGLLHAGCHLQTMLFFAAVSGETLWHIGSHHAGLDLAEMMQLCPRRVVGLPPSLGGQGAA